jgi:hypothetical protein
MKEEKMSKTHPLLSRNSVGRIGLTSLVCAMGVALAACGGATVTSSAPTATTAAGGISTAEPATAAPTLASTGPLHITDACTLVTKPQVEAALGAPVFVMKPLTDTTSIPGKTSYFCTVLGGSLALMVSVVDMGSPAAALTEMNKEFAKMKADDPSTVVTAETGIGDRAFWTTKAKACGYNALKGPVGFSVTMGGTIGDPAAHKAALKTLMQSIGAQL